MSCCNTVVILGPTKYLCANVATTNRRGTVKPDDSVTAIMAGHWTIEQILPGLLNTEMSNTILVNGASQSVASGTIGD